MIKKTCVAFLVTAMVLALSHQTIAQGVLASTKTDEAAWTLLGTRTVDYTVDRDVVVVADSGTYFKSLKFIVKNGTLNMHKCTVHFTNGDTKVIDFPSEVNNTNDGRVLELMDNDKAIEKVTFWYDSKNSSNNKSVVELWGK
jgi:predicted Zn-dependent protease